MEANKYTLSILRYNDETTYMNHRIRVSQLTLIVLPEGYEIMVEGHSMRIPQVSRDHLVSRAICYRPEVTSKDLATLRQSNKLLKREIKQLKDAVASQGTKLKFEESIRTEQGEVWTYRTRLSLGVIAGLTLIAVFYWMCPARFMQLVNACHSRLYQWYHGCFKSCGSLKRKLKRIYAIMCDDTERGEMDLETGLGSLNHDL